MHTPRLARLRTVFARRPVYFVTFCTVGRKPILNNVAIHSALLEFSDKASEYGAYVGRYVIMPDHIHLFVAMQPGAPSLSNWVKSLKNCLSRALRLRAHPAPHWQKGFFDHVLRSHDSYDQKWSYVIDNPVRAGLVSSPDTWPFHGVVHDLTVPDHRRS